MPRAQDRSAEYRLRRPATPDDVFNTGLKTALSYTGTLSSDSTNAGRFLIQGSLASTPAQTQNLTLYQIGNSQFLAVETDSSQFGLGILEQQQ